MWQQKKLTLSGDAGSIVCSVLDVHPWTPGAGQKEHSGLYLSPENAVAWAAKKLAGAPAGMDITALLFTAPTLAGFIATLSAAAAVFPLPVVTQTYRRAATAATLADTRMQIPARPGGLPAAAPLAVASLRKATAAAAQIAAGAPASVSIDGALRAFKAQRAGAIKAARERLGQLTAGSVSVSAISTVKNTAGAIMQMGENIPHPDHVFSLCIVLAGDDLSAFRGMLTDDRQ